MPFAHFRAISLAFEAKLRAEAAARAVRFPLEAWAAETAAELEQMEHEVEMACEAIGERHLQDLAEQRARETERKLGRQLGIPVRVQRVYLIRLRQPSERSSGRGMARRAVIHLQLLEPWAPTPRFRRAAHSILCGTRGGWDIGR